jgi:hypothetical protein
MGEIWQMGERIGKKGERDDRVRSAQEAVRRKNPKK